MNSKIKVLAIASLPILWIASTNLGQVLGFVQPMPEQTQESIQEENDLGQAMDEIEVPSDKLDMWSQSNEAIQSIETASLPSASNLAKEPLEVGWKLLMDIEYELKYFEAIEMEIYAPVFSDEVKAIDGKEVVIKGYVIPIDEEKSQYALSANPYSSCFFCGKAGPASVISMYMKNKKKRYKVDDLRKFRGVIQLNYDNPDEFYYILKEAH
ncbi:MAG: hypothetical protein AAFP19_23135 [Bacteroidota bacterium]